MDNSQTTNYEQAGRKPGSTAQIIAFATAASVTAAAVGIAAYVYLHRRAMSTPKYLLEQCRVAVDQIERSLEVSHA